MTYTYKIIGGTNDEQVIAKIRLAIDDTVEDKGPRPDARNFSDEEILSVYADEGDSTDRAVANMLEKLSSAWARAPRTMFGSLIDPTRISRDYREQAMVLRQQYGYGASGAAAGFSLPMTNEEPSTS